MTPHTETDRDPPELIGWAPNLRRPYDPEDDGTLEGASPREREPGESRGALSNAMDQIASALRALWPAS